MGNTTDNAGQSEANLPPQLGHYDLGEKIGQGGMAVVYKGLQPSLNRTVAIKVLPPQFANSPELLARFEREAAIVANLNHSNIVQVIDRGRDGSFLYIVMEYVEGQNLEKLIRDGTLTLPQVIDIASQICDGLVYAHRAGVVHRDLKPSNILVDQRIGRAKIADFGIAALESTDAGLVTLTVSHTVIGTMNYMSPEQRRDSHNVSSLTDIFSFGVILYEMLTGKLPVGHFKLPSMVRPEVPLGIDSIVKRCLAESPDDRYPDAGQIRDELQRLTTHRSSPRSFSALGRLTKRQQWLALIGGAALVLILLVSAAVLARHFRKREPETLDMPHPSVVETQIQSDYVRAQGLVSQGRWREAIAAFQDLVRKHPEHPVAAEAQFGAASAYEQLQERERSIQEYKRFIQTYPTSSRFAEAVVKKCRLEFEKGRQRRVFGSSVWDIDLQDRLIAELQAMLDKQTSGADAIPVLALMAEISERPTLSRTREAAAMLMKIHALDPAGGGDALYHAAELNDTDKGDHEKALESYALFVKEFASDPRASKAQERLKRLKKEK